MQETDFDSAGIPYKHSVLCPEAKQEGFPHSKITQNFL